MTYVWSSSFEGFPGPSNFGNTMGRALRRVKGAFEERFEVEHVLDYSSNAHCVHRSGECTVVLLDSNSAQFVDGGLQYEDSKLYKEDAQGNLEPITTGDHQTLIGTDDNDHPQYWKIDGTDKVDFDLEVDEITNLPTTYSSSLPDGQVLSRGQHIGSGSPDGNKHPETVFDTSEFIPTPGYDVFKHTEITDNLNYSGTEVEVRLDDYCSLPSIAGASGAILAASEVDNDDYVASFRVLVSTGDSDGSLDITYKRFDA